MFDFFKKKEAYPVGEDGLPLATYEEVGVIGSINAYIEKMRVQAMDMRMGILLIDRIFEGLESMSRIVAREKRINLRVIDALHEFCEKTIYIQTGNFGQIPKDLDENFTGFREFYLRDCLTCYEHLYRCDTPGMFTRFEKPYGWDRPKDEKGRPINHMWEAFKDEVTKYALSRDEDPSIYLSTLEEAMEEGIRERERELPPLNREED